MEIANIIGSIGQAAMHQAYYTIVLYVFLVLLAVQLLYFWGLFVRLAFGKQKKPTVTRPPVSVILVAHNQYNDLNSNLQSFLAQSYPNFEVVVVNDNSDDGSDELLKTISMQHDNLKIVELRQHLNWFKGRKFPLSIGIKSATHEVLLLSDIRYRPATNNWISRMMESYAPRTEIVLGYASFATPSKINLWYRFTAFYDGLFYLSMALSGFTFKGVGKNLSYQKSLFYREKGFSSHYVINSGDDELFVNKSATRNNVAVQINPAGQTARTKAITFSQWLTNEKNKLAIRRHFKFGHRATISIFNTTTFSFFLLFAMLLISGYYFELVLGAFALRLISQMVIFGFSQKKLSEKRLIIFAPVLEIIHVLIDFLLWISLLFTRKKKWK
jgi:glycosyltransferase involved in cell wall biosynthesis